MAPTALTSNINPTENHQDIEATKLEVAPQHHPPPKRVPPQAKGNQKPGSQTNAARKASKPIINWLQRKLAGTVKSKRQASASHPVPKGQNTMTVKMSNRVVSSPLPSNKQKLENGKPELLPLEDGRRKTVSLNSNEQLSAVSNDDLSSEGSLNAPESLWSPASGAEADEDASVRPIPPSVPPSPSPSPSSSSYLSDPRTFGSIAASTKPTTVLSVDINGNGMAHIAQAPATPVSTQQTNRIPLHVRTSSNMTNPNVTFSALPPSPQSSRPSSVQSRAFATAITTSIPSVQAPLHTAHHPRNNPRPSSPPLDNASILTLASSAFAMTGFRGVGVSGWGSAPASAIGLDSTSHFGDSLLYDLEDSSHHEEDTLDERDVDASMRALRPRSSRRGSWESEASRWSARIQAGPGTPVTRERSVTANSIKTGGFRYENDGSPDAVDTVGDDVNFASRCPSPSTPGPLDIQLPPSRSDSYDNQPIEGEMTLLTISSVDGIVGDANQGHHDLKDGNGKDQETPVQEREALISDPEQRTLAPTREGEI